jgi:hypothetical protein
MSITHNREKRRSTTRRCRQIFHFLQVSTFRIAQTLAVAAGLLATASMAEEPKQDPDTIVFALMSGKCSILKVAGRDFKCRAVAFFQTEEGRANFTVALDDPADSSHIVTFSGAHGVRSQDNLYELPIDQMQLKSKDRPKVDGLPVPLIEATTGNCRLVGSLATQQVSSISCSATDNGRKYQLQFDSDGSPMTLRRIRRTSGPVLMSPFD